MTTERESQITGVAESYVSYRLENYADGPAAYHVRRAASEHSDDAIIAEGLRQGRGYWQMLQRNKATA